MASSSVSTQELDVLGDHYRLTFVYGFDSRGLLSYLARGSQAHAIPPDLLEPFRHKVNLFRVQGYTAAHLENGSGLNHWGVGFCSHNEPGGFSREKGQRRALAAALLNAWPDSRERRSHLWGAFNDHNPLPRRDRSRADNIEDVAHALAIGSEILLQVQGELRRRMRRVDPRARALLRTLAGWL